MTKSDLIHVIVDFSINNASLGEVIEAINVYACSPEVRQENISAFIDWLLLDKNADSKKVKDYFASYCEGDINTSIATFMDCPHDVTYWDDDKGVVRCQLCEEILPFKNN